MLASSTAFAILVICFPFGLAQVIPTTPGPNETYSTGSNCKIAWNLDTSGTWTNMSIALMSGSNINMSLVTNVASGLDGNNQSLTPYSWMCPDVDPHSAIYFYQFTNGNDTSARSWTTRFTIASSSNETEPTANDQQPNGDAIPWGIGHLLSKAIAAGISVSSQDMSSATEPPSVASTSAPPQGITTPMPTLPTPAKKDSRSRHEHESASSDGTRSDIDTAMGDDRHSAKATRTANIAEAKSQAARASAVAHRGSSASASEAAEAASLTPVGRVAQPVDNTSSDIPCQCNKAENGAYSSRLMIPPVLVTSVLLVAIGIVTAAL